jgi:hypothetical protein
MIGKTNTGIGGTDVYVVGGTTRPARPRNNTIWVETNTAITGWEIGYKRPEAPAEGDVFIFTNPSAAVVHLEISGVSGRARKEIVKISPAYAYQYINSVWENKNMKLYVNNGWLDAMVTLYDRGAYGVSFASGWSTGEQSDCVHIATRGGMAVTSVTSTSNGTIDLTGIKTLNIEWRGKTGDPDSDYGANIDMRVIDATTGNVLWHDPHSIRYDSGIHTSSIDVSSWTNTVKFQLYSSSSLTSADVWLYSIKLVPGNPT